MKALDDIEDRWMQASAMHAEGVTETTLRDSAADVPQLVKTLRAVLELHVSDGESQGYTPDGYRVIPSACSQCGTLGEYGIPWPCATVRAIESALAPRPQIIDEQVEAALRAFLHADPESPLRSSLRAALEAAAEVQR